MDMLWLSCLKIALDNLVAGGEIMKKIVQKEGTAYLNVGAEKPSHTPGAWMAVKNNDQTYAVTFNHGPQAVVHSINKEANARLIAAAPELLDLLKRIANQSESTSNPNDKYITSSQVEEAFMLIAKTEPIQP